MKKGKTEKRVKALGWKDGTVAEFLGLTPEESALVEIKLALSRKLRERRQKRMTQAQLARELQSSQSRIAKAETGEVRGGKEWRVDLVRPQLQTKFWPA